MSNVQLGFYVEQPPRGLKVIRTLSDLEFEQFTRGERLLWDFVADYQQFEMVRSSHAEYKQLVDVAKFIIQLPTPDVLSQGAKITINMTPSG